MYTNADITIYNKYLDKATRLDKYKRTIILNVFWDERKAYNRLQSGIQDADSVLVLIPFKSLATGRFLPPNEFKGADDTFTLRVGDKVVRGAVDYETTTGSDLDKNYEAFTVTSVDKKDFGSYNMQHFEVGGK